MWYPGKVTLKCGKGGEGSKSGQRQKLVCDAVARKASANPTGSSRIVVALHSCPELDLGPDH